MKKFLLWTAGILAGFWLIGIFSNNTSSSNETSIDKSTVISTVDTSNVPASNGWTYSDSEDKMTSKKTFYASVEANNLLHFDFPYDGGTTATLYVRKMSGKTDVFVEFTKAQLILDSYEGSNFRVRFDKKPASTYTFTGASDHSSNIAFLQNTSKFIKNLKNSKKVIIEMEFYKEGNRAIEFDIENFKWNH